MKRKIVLWGTNEKDEKILLALQLKDKEGKVNIYTFDENQATEELYNKLLNQWREGVEVEFPEGHTLIERPLNMTDSILPDTLKVDRTDLIARAQTEWHFVVLSSKLYEMYRTELEDFQETVESLKEFDNKIWNEMKSFWGKVQEQVNEKNLFREHANTLKSKTNKIFDQLKGLKKKLEEEFEAVSSKHKETIMSELAEVEAKVEKGLGLKPIFEQLKQLQNSLKGKRLTRKDRDAIWQRLDKAFKDVKEKRFGDKGNTNNASGRLQRRLDGLHNAISKMEKSITRDKDDLKFQDRKISTTDGQLEMQIRQAKVKMIEERVRSKEEKLKDMYSTRTELQAKVKKEKDKEERKAKMDEAKAAAEAKIASEVKKAAAEQEGNIEKLEEAAAKIAEAKKAKAKKAKISEKKEEQPTAEESASEENKEDVKSEQPEEESLLDAVATTVGEAVEGMVDTIKAAAEVTKETIASSLKDDEAQEEEGKDDGKKEDKKSDSLVGAIVATVGDALEDVVDTVKAVADVVEEKIEEKIDSISEEE